MLSEPGRALVSNSMSLILKVNLKKKINYMLMMEYMVIFIMLELMVLSIQLKYLEKKINQNFVYLVFMGRHAMPMIL